MTTTTTALERVTDDVFSDIELRTLAGFLGGYSGLTRDAYALDLRQFAQWCHDRRIALFAVARADIEAFARGRLVGVEVKAAETVHRSDFAGLRHLQSRLGDRFHFGLVLYAGTTVASFGEGLVAAPIDLLWQ